MADYDVIVVGAGPSGTSAAKGCAEAGLKTLLLDAQKLPRFKPCGGGVTTKANKILDFKIPREIIERKAYGIRIHYGSNVTAGLKEKPITTLVMRDKFDALLADKAVSAGATLMDETSVSSVSNAGSVQVVDSTEGRFTSNIVVGADGVNSVVAGRVRNRFTADELASTIEAEIPMSESEIDERYNGYLEVYFGSSARIGYGWIFPKKRHISVGVGSLLKLFKNPKDRFTDFMKAAKLPSDGVKLHPHLIPLGNPKRPVVSDGIVLVGDAAGYVDPLTGEGIYHAIYSGKLAAHTIASAFQKKDYSKTFLETYYHNCVHAFSDEFRRARKAALVIYGMPLLSYPLILGNKEVLDKFIDIMSGGLTYKTFKQWAAPRAPYLVLKSIFR